MQRNVSKLESLAAECGFAFDAEDDVTIQLKSPIIEGDLKILLRDDANQTIKRFENNTSIKEKVSLKKSVLSRAIPSYTTRFLTLSTLAFTFITNFVPAGLFCSIQFVIRFLDQFFSIRPFSIQTNTKTHRTRNAIWARYCNRV